MVMLIQNWCEIGQHLTCKTEVPIGTDNLKNTRKFRYHLDFRVFFRPFTARFDQNQPKGRFSIGTFRIGTAIGTAIGTFCKLLIYLYLSLL